MINDYQSLHLNNFQTERMPKIVGRKYNTEWEKEFVWLKKCEGNIFIL